MLFCVAGVTLCDIPTCFRTVFCGRRNILAQLSEDELHFSWQAQHFGDIHCHVAWQEQHFRRVALRALHSTLHCQIVAGVAGVACCDMR